MINLTNLDIIDIILKAEHDLLNGVKIKFNRERTWSSNFSTSAGVYMLFDKEKVIYIGESANLKERMKEIKRTINHTFRRKLGKHLFKNAQLEKGKFNPEIEDVLNSYFLENISVSAIEVLFGRTEIESNLIKKYEELDILNSKSKRNATQFV